MKIGILGDIHLRATKPINRVDNYYETQFDKLTYAYKTFKKNDCKCVLIPGDFFHDYGKDPYSITYDAIAFFLLNKLTTFLVFGQHDLKFHNPEITAIPIQILNKTSLIYKLESNPVQINNVCLYGKGWNEQWPTPKRTRKINILVMHHMLIKANPLWPGQTGFVTVNDMQKMKYDLIVAGDNHNGFTYNNGNKTIINCGSMMRMNIDQIDHKPFFCIYNCETKQTKKFEFPIKDSKTVFKTDIRKQDKEFHSEQLEIFSTSLNSVELDGELNFRTNVNQVMMKKKIGKRTKELIEQSLSL